MWEVNNYSIYAESLPLDISGLFFSGALRYGARCTKGLSYRLQIIRTHTVSIQCLSSSLVLPIYNVMSTIRISSMRRVVVGYHFENIGDHQHDIHIKEVKKEKSNARVIAVRTGRWQRGREKDSPTLRLYKNNRLIKRLCAFCSE